mgnify:CR=1 FL=1|tara:strand:+ start:3196 stop:4386 length:1191 start_codon:yes stop_codon:yes gene_type:complete
MNSILSGIKVLEIGHMLAGPFCTMNLADLGATVIKIENPSNGDPSRSIDNSKGESTYFNSLNRGKKSITINLKKPEGQKLAQKLASNVDILVENYVPGHLKNFGLDYQTIKRINPKIIYASISGFGQTGPYKNFPAFDIIIQAMSGLMSITGNDEDPPIRTGISLGDSVAGLFSTVAILAALWKRNFTNQGTNIDIAMLDSLLTMLENPISRFLTTGEIPQKVGARHPSIVPFQMFKTTTDYIVLAITPNSSKLWADFCMAIGEESIILNKQFNTSDKRNKNYTILKPIMENAIAKKSANYWIKKFHELNIACSKTNTIDEITKDKQVLHRNILINLNKNNKSKNMFVNTPFKIKGYKSGPQAKAPLLGESTEEIITSELNINKETFSQLKKNKII